MVKIRPDEISTILRQQIEEYTQTKNSPKHHKDKYTVWALNTI